MTPSRPTALVARIVTALVVGSLLVACASSDRAAAKAPSAPAGYGGDSTGYAQQPGYPQQQPGAYPAQPPPSEPASPPPPPPAPGSLGGQPGGGAASRTMAFSKAMDDIDTSQRQLDVAAGDCNNACRALGSMDRAAGRLCALAQGSDEGRRCDDAKKKVYSARDRVKQTCNTCPDGVSVERSAPIPSVR